MTFDAIDRKYRRKAPIALECTECECTTPDVRTRQGIEDDPVLCDACHAVKLAESWGGY